MARKIKVKLILELRAAQISQREICRTRKISHHSVIDVYRIADQLGITYEDIKDKSEEEVYRFSIPINSPPRVFTTYRITAMYMLS